jgi:hypothetical protein
MLLIAGQSMQNIFILLEFKLNQNYIAAHLCENRDKPQLHCNGKCQLSKELKKADEESNTSNTTAIQFKHVELFSEVIPEIDLSCEEIILHQPVFYSNKVCEGWTNCTFHPPSLS